MPMLKLQLEFFEKCPNFVQLSQMSGMFDVPSGC